MNGIMVPYFPQPHYHLFGPVTVHAFGALVAAAVITGWNKVVSRCRRKGLAPEICEDLLIYVFCTGFLVAHLYSVLAYFPQEALKDPLILLKVWENISSFGGIVGGVLGLGIYFRFKGREIRAAERLEYLDAIAYAFPFAWTVGRLGCTVAHDHPGVVTSFPLAVSLKTAEAQAYITSVYQAAGRLAELPPAATLRNLGFHDLGWYEFLYTLLVIVPVFLMLDRKSRRPGFFVAAFLLLYVPVRFLLDFLRLSDTRYYGLTPGQYAAAAVFLGALLWVVALSLRGGRGEGAGGRVA
jgi:phosphatidylglycerol---prolipoprotein diacylglyceryl transferase